MSTNGQPPTPAAPEGGEKWNNARYRALLRALREIASSDRHHRVRNDAKRRRRGLRSLHAFLKTPEHPIVLVGPVGVGKSSLMTVLTGLHKDQKPRSASELRSRSVVSVASGRTTLCEVEVNARKAEPGQGRIEIKLDAVTHEEIKELFKDLVTDRWRSLQPVDRDDREHMESALGVELSRALRNLTNTKHEREQDDDPLDRLIGPPGNVNRGVNELLRAYKGSSRKGREWTFHLTEEDAYGRAQKTFRTLNLGQLEDAPLPARIVVNYFVGEHAAAGWPKSGLRVIDTRGLDGPVEGRDDILSYIRDPRTILVICSDFKSAPDAQARDVLNAIRRDGALENIKARTMLMVLDHDDASGVTDADDDAAKGRALKLRECKDALRRNQLAEVIEEANLLVADVALQGHDDILHAFMACRLRIRKAASERFRQQVLDGERFCGRADDIHRQSVCSSIDEALARALSKALSTPAPSISPAHGLAESLRSLYYASCVYAMARRKGRYDNGNAYSLIRSRIRADLSAWLMPAKEAVSRELIGYEREAQRAGVEDHLRVRQAAMESECRSIVDSYGDQCLKQIERQLFAAEDMWRRCVNYWGGGPGFMMNVADTIRGWERSQPGLPPEVLPDAVKIRAKLGKALGAD